MTGRVFYFKCQKQETVRSILERIRNEKYEGGQVFFRLVILGKEKTPESTITVEEALKYTCNLYPLKKKS